MAGLAFLHGRNADAGFGAARGFLEADLEVVAQVRAAIEENIAEDVGKGIGEAAETRTSGAGPCAGIHAGVAEAVVGGALVAVGQDFVGFLRFLEMFLGLGVVRIPVRVPLHRELAVRLLDIVVGGVPVYTEHFVIVAF